MIYKILPDHDPILHTPAEKFNFREPQMDPKELFQNLKETMIANKGLGLSAPQVGIPYQVFVIGDYRNPDSIFSVFNPVVVNEEHPVMLEEGCITYPGLFIKINRPGVVRARFAGHDGQVGTIKFNGFTARTFLHEYDHLQGITFVHRASALQLDKARKQKKKLDRARKQNGVVM
jgi:peptide deformylase